MDEDSLSDNSGNLEDSDDDGNDAVSSTSHDPIHHDLRQSDGAPKQKKKRKRKEGRKRIRKILSEEQLDSETLSAQKEEQERLRRLELQKSLNTATPAARSASPLDKSSPHLETTNVPAQPVVVDVPRKDPDRIIVIDDSDDECDIIIDKPQPLSDCVIILDSDSEHSTEEENEADEEPENSGSHTNDDVNQPDVHGRVLVNVNHPPTEPDIFLASHLCSVAKPHQIGGIRFLYDNLVESLSRYEVSPGFGCILAHSMGLGKTLQVICFIDVFLQFTKATKVLCIVPMNTIQNWYSEFNLWLPEAPSSQAREQTSEEGLMKEDGNQEKQGRTFQVLLLGESVKTTVARSALIGNWEKNGGVLLMGYEMYRILAMYTPSLVNNTKLTGSKRKRTNTNTTEVIDLDEEEKNMDLLLEVQKSLCKPGPDLVVCDEGHRIKNSQANISQALKKIHTRRRVVLTGYPLQNNLMEYWCMVDFVRPNFLGTRHEFSNMFERPIVNGQCVDSTASDIKLMRFRAHVLHSLLEGFVQRRSEAVLTKTLPEKEEYVIPVKMTSVQKSLYKAFVTSAMRYVGYINPIKAFGICIKIWNHPDILKNYLDSKKDASRNASPLTVCDPDLDIGVSVSKKTKDSKNDAKLQLNTNSDTTMCPPDPKAIANVSDWVGDLMDNYKTGVLQHGSKLVILMELIDKSLQMGDKILVFSQSLSTLSLIEDFLRKRVVPPLPSQLMFQPVHWEKNKNYYRLDGGTSSQERDKLITAFNSKTNQSVYLFLLSTRACSLGVNLIGGNRVVIFDASWNPCHDAQAVCRIYRYGQTKKCFIYRLVSYGTFEKRMYERQITKEGMSDRVIDELNPEANLTKLEVMHLFKEQGSDDEDPSLNISANAFPDPVLNYVCGTCHESILETPFKHKLQSSRKLRNILTKAEKREAKKGYEREKRAIDSANKYSSSSTVCSPLVREQIRKEVINRPIGHVKPIQSVQASASPPVGQPVSSLPLPVQPYANPFRADLPSMAYMAGMTLPPLLNNRFYQTGELRPLSPYPSNFPLPYPFPEINPDLRPSSGIRQPIVVDLLTSPEEKSDAANKVETTPKSAEKNGEANNTANNAVKTSRFDNNSAASFLLGEGLNSSRKI
ncbi:helicase ARIP4-like isoform X2 [Dendronephthya gigantea]|uniref:helicase ARIP4-like isoform X2 n=1 Tax=Dendronephthya gigantea TaxID=151771 RepID=UPI00106C8DC2|nr:helicase ARIP4-like isoform X2 [Dendronephthya gigantea]